MIYDDIRPLIELNIFLETVSRIDENLTSKVFQERSHINQRRTLTEIFLLHDESTGLVGPAF